MTGAPLPVSILCAEGCGLGGVGERHPSGVDDAIDSHQENGNSHQLLPRCRELGLTGDDCHDAFLTSVRGREGGREGGGREGGRKGGRREGGREGGRD